MRILGIHDGHNAAAAVLVDGRVVAAVQEERFNRVKNWSGFPRQSIDWVLAEAHLSPAEIDAVGMANLHMPYPKRSKGSSLSTHRAPRFVRVRDEQPS